MLIFLTILRIVYHMKNPEDKLSALQQRLLGMRRAVIAFSGGTDSSFLLHIAANLKDFDIVAVTADSPIHPARELADAHELTRKLKVEHLIVKTGEMVEPAFLSNPPRRCYYCKKLIFSEIKKLAAAKGIDHIVDGTNRDDSVDFRPGLEALRELGIESPLRDAGLGKSEIRRLAREAGLPSWDKPAAACLASRIPYGYPISVEKLSRIEQAEDFLRTEGFLLVRVRDHGEVARIELDPERIADLLEGERAARILKKLKGLGYTFVSVDLEGYRTGSLNESLITEK